MARLEALRLDGAVSIFFSFFFSLFCQGPADRFSGGSGRCLHGVWGEGGFIWLVGYAQRANATLGPHPLSAVRERGFVCPEFSLPSSGAQASQVELKLRAFGCLRLAVGAI